MVNTNLVATGIFAVLLTIGPTHGQSTESKSDLADSVAEYLETISFDGSPSSSSVTPGLLKFGDVTAGQEYICQVKFANQSGEVVSATSAKACCGASLEYLQHLKIQPGETSTFIVHLLKQKSPGRYANTLHLIMNDLVDWPINVEAYFKSPIELTPTRIDLSESAEPFMVTASSVSPMITIGKFELKPQAGVLRIVSSEFDEPSGELKLMLIPTQQTLGAVGVKLESFDVVDTHDSRIHLTLPFAVKLPPRIIHKPSTVTLRPKADSEIVFGSGILTGAQELLVAIEKSGTIAVVDNEGEVVCKGEYEIKSSNARIIVLEYVFGKDVEKVRNEFQRFRASLFDLNGNKICDVPEIHFPN